MKRLCHNYCSNLVYIQIERTVLDSGPQQLKRFGLWATIVAKNALINMLAWQLKWHLRDLHVTAFLESRPNIIIIIIINIIIIIIIICITIIIIIIIIIIIKSP